MTESSDLRTNRIPLSHGTGLSREDIFVTTKLWNTNHRPERVEPAFLASLERLQLKYLDLYLSHTPFAFQPGDDPDPRDASGNVIYDRRITNQACGAESRSRGCDV